MKKIICKQQWVMNVLLVSVLAVAFGSTASSLAIPAEKNDLAIATYCADYDQVCQAAALVKSLRRFGEIYSKCQVYVALGDTADFSTKPLRMNHVYFLPLKVDSMIAGYPLAIKAEAGALVEKVMPSRVKTLAWFDPETMILGSLHDLDLADGYDAALRPVFQVNKIGLAADEKPDAFWAGIISVTGLELEQWPLVETVLDQKTIRSYYNCEVFSINPRLGILQAWAGALRPLVSDTAFQRTACTTFLKRLLLHQAVLSAVISARIPAERMWMLPLTCAYPLNPYTNVPAEKAAASLNALTSVIFEDTWVRDPNWMNLIRIDEPLASWLNVTYQEFLSLRRHDQGHQ